MSQFIEGVKHFQTPPVLQTPRKQIIVPKLRKLLKTHYDVKQLNNNKNDEKFLMQLSQKLTDHQFDQIHKNNQKMMEKEFSKLKKKLKYSFRNNSVESILNNQKTKNNKLNVRLINKFSADKIDIGKKYFSKFSQKMVYVNQANQILLEKTNYNKWLNSSNNGILSSPNYNKMIFLVEKTKHLEKVDQNLIPKQLKDINKKKLKINPVIHKIEHSMVSKSSLKNPPKW